MSSDPFQPRPAPDDESRRARRRTLLICSCTCALIVLDTNIVAVALPSLARALHAGFGQLEWIVSAYMLAFAALLLPAGSLADRYGRRRVMLLGLGLFVCASLLCGLAGSVPMLQLARALKGVGAAMLLTSALAVIGHSFHTDQERSAAWAVWGACMGLAMTVAPLLGGLITALLGWRWIFLINLPVGLVLAWLVHAHIDESADPGAARLDPWGSVTLSGALACLIWAMIDAHAAGWQATLLRCLCGAALLALFVGVELAQARPMVDLRLMRAPRSIGAVLATFGYAASGQVMMTFLPLYWQNALTATAVGAGLAMLPFALTMLLLPRASGWLERRMPLHGVLAIGFALLAVGDLIVAVGAHGACWQLVAAGMAVTGSGAGLLNGNAQQAIMRCIPRERAGMASGISTTTRFATIVLALACLGGVLSARTGSALDQQLAARGLPPVGAEQVERIVAGDAQAALDNLAPPVRARSVAAARAAFGEGFALLMVCAALLAAGCGALVFALMRERGVRASGAGQGDAAPVKIVAKG